MLRQLLASFPALDKQLRQLYLRLQYPRRREPGFTHWIHPQVRLLSAWDWVGIAPEPGELFFGYYDRSPWDDSEDRMLFHFRKSLSDPTVEIRLLDKNKQTSLCLGTTRAWTYQQGAMTTWLPGGNRAIFNVIAGGSLVSRIVDTDGKEPASLPMPIQTVHPSGREALTLNYRRLWRLRAEYGYRYPVSNFSPSMPLENDGVWKLSLESGRTDLLVSLSDLMRSDFPKDVDPQQTKVNHLMYSPSGSRFVFVHRWYKRGVKFTRFYVMNTGGSGLTLLVDFDPSNPYACASHYCWIDEETLIAHGRPPGLRPGYYSINVTNGTINPLTDAGLNSYGDGHPSCSPDRRWMLTDSYPNRKYQQRLLIQNRSKSQITEIGRFLHSPRYHWITRCDLHPRWSPGGNFVSFDSVFAGTRMSYILDLSKLLLP